jgi:hypothetical protein
MVVDAERCRSGAGAGLAVGNARCWRAGTVEYGRCVELGMGSQSLAAERSCVMVVVVDVDCLRQSLLLCCPSGDGPANDCGRDD